MRRYAPYGYAATVRYLRERYGSLNDPAALAAALSALESSRRVWLREVSDFGARRRSMKGHGRRRVGEAELLALRQQRWPGGESTGGPPAGTAADRPVAHEFLARYGMTAWIPEPVNHRRRARRLPAVPSLYENVFVTLGCGGFTLVVIAAITAFLANPPAIFWWTFTNSGATLLAVIAGRAMYRNSVRRGHSRAIGRQRIAAGAALAEQRWDTERRRSFNLQSENAGADRRSLGNEDGD